MQESCSLSSLQATSAVDHGHFLPPKIIFFTLSNVLKVKSKALAAAAPSAVHFLFR